MEKKTKIVCTLGPASWDEEVLRGLISEGMNVVRFNFSHTKASEIMDKVIMIKELRKSMNIPLSLMLDTKGAEVRLFGFSEPLPLTKGSEIFIESYTKNDIETLTSPKQYHFYTNLPNITKLGKIDAKVLMMDGFLQGTITSKNDAGIFVTLINNGILRPKPHLALPKVDYPLPFLSEKDKEDILFALKNDFDYIALSFVSNAADLYKIKNLIYDNAPHSKIKLIAKIEKQKAVENIDEILAHSDGIMVARGDLGVEMDIEEVPIIQKKIIEKCYLAGKPVITATQMLESMVENPIPTRAEASDVANACFDLTSAVMLSAETAIGHSPQTVVSVMRRIIEKVEEQIDYQAILDKILHQPYITDLTSIVTSNAVSIAYQSKAKAIIVVTKSGYSARMISKLRPRLPIHAFTSDETTFHQLALNWGIFPYIMQEEDTFESLVQSIVKTCEKEKFAERGDRIVIVAGLPLGKQGTTNMVRIETVGKLRLAGKCLNKSNVSGAVIYIDNKQDLENKEVSGKVIFLKNYKKEYIPFFKLASAIVMENDDYENDLLLVGLAYHIPIFLNARGMFDLIQEGSMIEIIGERDLLLEL